MKLSSKTNLLRLLSTTLKPQVTCSLIIISELNKNEALLTNRAASYIQLKKYKEALFDCEQALYCNPSFVKAHQRAYKCYLSLGDLEVFFFSHHILESQEFPNQCARPGRLDSLLITPIDSYCNHIFFSFLIANGL